MLLSFLAMLAIFVLIGVSSALFSRNKKHDYYLASQSIPPSLVGLSAVATNNSGYMFIGAIGYTYATGLSSVWLMFGWILGDFLACLYVHRQLRVLADTPERLSYASILAKNPFGMSKKVQRLAGLISLVFLVAYASAQFIAGSKALHVLLGWPLWSGAVLSSLLVMVYCFSGGIRASIWTDAAQSIVMISAMCLLLASGMSALGGMDNALDLMAAHDNFLSLWPEDTIVPGFWGVLLFVVGWFFAGVSVVGQPHVMLRFMTIDKTENIFKAKCWYYFWFTAFYSAAIAVGMLSRVILTESASFDAELALPRMAEELLPPYLVGIVLAGIFAATMSTADSIVLSSSAAITHDLLPSKDDSTRRLKLVTGLVTMFALIWALLSSQTVFSLVIMAWSALAGAFAPLLIGLCLGLRPSERTAIVTMLSGLVVALGWRFLGLQSYIYEGMPAILVGAVILALAHRLRSADATVTEASQPRC